MWMMIPEGFVSVTLCPPEYQTASQPLMQVRGRRSTHIAGFMKRAGLPNNYEILETPNNDYRFRVILKQEEFMYALQQIAQSVDYPNFKNAAHKATPDHMWGDALNEVWHIIGDLQPGGPYNFKALYKQRRNRDSPKL